MRRIISYLFFFLLIASQYVFAQTRELDSLKQVVRTSQVDTIQIKAAIEIGDKIRRNQQDSAIIYYNKAINLCNIKLKTINSKIELIRFKYFKANSLHGLGIIGYYESNYLDAEKYYKQSLVLRQEIGDVISISKSLNNLGLIYENQGQIELALEHHFLALKKREEIGDKEGISSSLNNLAIIYLNQGQNEQALKFFKRALRIAEEINDKESIGIAFNNIASVYREQDDLQNAIIYNEHSLKIREEISDKIGIAASLNNLGSIYQDLGEFDKALKFYLRSLKIREEVGSKAGLALSLNNLSSLKLILKEDTLALRYGLKSLEIAKEVGHVERMRLAYGNLHDVYLYQKNYPAALEMYKLHIQMRDSINNEENQKKSLQNKMQYEFEKTTALQKAAFEKTQDSLKLVNERKMALQALDFEYAQKQAQAKTEEERKQLLFEEELKRNQIESDYKQKQAALEAERQRKEALAKADQEKKEAIAKEEKEKQRLILLSVTIGLLLVLVFAGFMYNRYKLTQRQKAIIEKQKEEVDKQRELADSRRIIAEEQKEIIEAQKHLVEEKQKEVLDSIHYASRIQRAMLTSEDYISIHLHNADPASSAGIIPTDSLTKRSVDQGSAQEDRNPSLSGVEGRSYFILYKPKDIVAGDFYWAQHHNNLFYLCTADCTGHGVPGAFMSLLNIGFLNENVIERGLKMPHEILETQRYEIIKALNPKGDENSKDGMDCVLAAFDFENMKLHFAQANNPLVIIRPNNLQSATYDLLEYKAQKMPIGRSLREHEPFELQTVDIQKGDIVYTWSDGYPDQFGANGKKFMSKNLKNLLLEIAHLPLSEQKEALDQKLAEHMGNTDQIDDVLVIGVKI